MNLRGRWEAQKKRLTLLWSFTKFVSRRNLLLRVPAYLASSLLGRVPRLPLFIVYYATRRCNLRCVMCNQEPYNVSAGAGDHTGEFLSFLGSLPDRKFSLFFSGGEPFVLPGLMRLIEEGKRKGCHVGLVTNGTLCTPEVIERLVALRLDYIIFTLHGTREVHARITGSDAAYDRTVDAVRRYAGTPGRRTFVVLNAAVTPLNYTSLDELVSVGAGLGVDLVRFENLNFLTREEAARNEEAVRALFPGVPFLMNEHLTDEILGGMAGAVRSVMETPYPVRVAVKPWMTPRQLSMWYSPRFAPGRGCDMIRHTLCIGEDGTATVCNFQRLEVGNVFRDGLDAVWRAPVFDRFRAVVAERHLPGCARCCRL